MKNILILAAVAALAACTAKQPEEQKTNLTVTETSVAVEGAEVVEVPADETANAENPAK